MKYFGIGLPKTGTKSLSVALNMCGVVSIHEKLHVSYDDADAFVDTPIWADYQELDIRYPNSKYILTIRDPEEWVTSFEKNLIGWYNGLKLIYNQPQDHLSMEEREDIKAFAKVFKWKEFDRKVFIKIFNDHNNEAIEYFKDRQEQLLVLKIYEPEAWNKFIEFVNPPKIFFPKITNK